MRAQNYRTSPCEVRNLSAVLAAGGDGGNRNRVRKSIPKAFYERSVSFKVPFYARRDTGWQNR